MGTPGAPKLEEARKGPPGGFGGSHGPANALILDFWPPARGENKFPLFKPLGLRYQLTAALEHKSRCPVHKVLDAPSIHTLS